MKILNIFFCGALIMFLSCSSKKHSFENLIIGKWRIDSINNYMNGEENMIKVDSSENMYVGSTSNRSYFQFAQYNEAFLFKQKDSLNKRKSSFVVIGDSIIFKSLVHQKILKLTDTNLVTYQEVKINFFDNSIEHPRQFLTTYYTRIKGINK